VEAHTALEAACTRLHELDDIFSTWKPGSALNRFRAGILRLPQAPPEMALVLELCDEARALSQGWFDPWAMPGGFDPTGLSRAGPLSRRSESSSSPALNPQWSTAEATSPSSACPRTLRAWRIGIRHPWRPDALACVLKADRAVATSGCYERGPHLINPKNGRMLFRTASATVVGSSLPLCDALATALVAAEDAGPELVRSLDGYEAYVIGVDGEEDATEGIVFATEGVR